MGKSRRSHADNSTGDHVPIKRQAPWPYLTQKAAARRLNVDVEFLVGLANHPSGRLRAVKTVGATGEGVFLFNRDDVELLSGT